MAITIRQLAEMKRTGEKIPMVTAYDYTAARIADAAGIPIILVGDSLGMVVLGYDSTVPVTMDDMVRHGRMVSRGASQALVVVDLPFMSYQVDAGEALRNAGRLMQEAGAHTVKMEGGVSIAGTVRRIVDAGVPVMGHIGLTPQSVNALGGYRVQGRTKAAARRVLDDALALQEAGAYSVVLECVPAPLARAITERLTIPTIGIGAGPHCDGQVQVFHDMLGLFLDFVPKHARQYAELGSDMARAFEKYAEDVRSGAFPSEAESFTMNESLLADLLDV
ncbi:MAG: 3-methyl-2-oxobutanoate hydroxymethyltransferase [Chloroflexota bacterium]|nr:3-methyl-2-oxobutanoate hydroxymethyltransferase [Chloroflexota bacterium]MDE2960522.1 3-methyl-2-oxobutanoate hydroxymethyltransferase [Chloroflexota bacterium]